MKFIVSILILFTIAACDPIWMVKRETPVPAGDKECIRMAIQSAEGIKSVYQTEVSQSYSITGKKLSKPVVFQFETELQTGSVQFHKGKVTAYFASIGSGVPPGIARRGPKYLESIISAIDRTCNVPASTANKFRHADTLRVASSAPVFAALALRSKRKLIYAKYSH